MSKLTYYITCDKNRIIWSIYKSPYGEPQSDKSILIESGLTIKEAWERLKELEEIDAQQKGETT